MTIALAMVLLIGAPNATPPARWTEVAAPDEAQLRCAGRSPDVWAVQLERGKIGVVRARWGEPPPRALRNRGDLGIWPLRWARLSDGLIVIANKGEWGGWARWYSSDGKKTVALGDSLPYDLLRVDASTVVIAGQRSFTDGKGYVQWIRVERNGAWSKQHEVIVDSPVVAVAPWREGLLLMTLTGLRFAKPPEDEPSLVSDALLHLVPNSMVVVGDEIWVGAGRYVVALEAEAGSGAAAARTRWFVRRGCETPMWDSAGLCVCVH